MGQTTVFTLLPLTFDMFSEIPYGLASIATQIPLKSLQALV